MKTSPHPPSRAQAAPSRRLTAYQYAVQTLRADILQGRLAAGERLRQDDLAKRLAMSTTPVREALRTLISEGLVFFDAHRGAVVRGLTLEDVQEIYRLRKVLEPMMVEEAIRRTVSSSKCNRVNNLTSIGRRAKETLQNPNPPQKYPTIST